jgi:alpha-1,2-mannosyltransferase
LSVAAPSFSRAETLCKAAALTLVTVVVGAGQIWYGNRHDFFDLRIYRDAMRWWDAGNPLYSFWRPDATQGRLEFTYPPFAAYVFRPLAWLTAGETIWLYTALSVVAFGATVAWMAAPLARRFTVPRWFAVGLVLVLASALEPIREAYTFGQINFVLWALIVADLLVLAPRGSRATGVGIGLATALKLVPGVFILYLLASRRWRAAATATVTAALATGLAAALDPADSRSFWTDRVWRGEGIGQLHYTFNQSIMGTLARLASPDDPSRLLWLVLALPVLGYGLWRAGLANRRGDDLSGLALAGLVGSLVSPISWVHHLFWLVPAILVLTREGWTRDGAPGSRDRRLRFGAGFAVYTTVVFSVVALYEFTFDQPGGPLGFVLANWDVLVMLALIPTLPITDRAGDVYRDVSRYGATTNVAVTVA